MKLTKKHILELEAWIELEELIYEHRMECYCPEIESLEDGYYYIVRTDPDSRLHGRWYGVTFNFGLELTVHRVYPEDMEEDNFHVGHFIPLGHRDKMRLMRTLINYVRSFGERHKRKYEELNTRKSAEIMRRLGSALTRLALQNADSLDIPGPNGTRRVINLKALREQGHHFFDEGGEDATG